MTLKRSQYKIRSVRMNAAAEGGQLYELSPILYSSPWDLPKGTVLEVVSTPKEKS